MRWEDQDVAALNRFTEAATASERFQSRCNSQNSGGTLMSLAPACSIRRNAASCAASEVPPTASTGT